MIALCTMQILRSLESTVVVTSLPTIVKHLDLGSSYIWVTNIFFLTGAVTQPLTGQLAGLFGRRHIALLFVAFYTLGSGICGGAKTPAMLIAGRAIQGAGSGGMTTIMGIVISGSSAAALEECVPGDFGGDVCVWDGDWSGCLGGRLCRGQCGDGPRRLFANRTSIIIYVNTFIISMLNYWIFFFLSLYFQAVRLSSSTRSGVQILPIALITIPGAAIGALALSKWGKYKHLHIIGFALLAARIGSLSTLTKSSSTAQWIFQAGVSEVDSAAVTASWSSVRSFGNSWGVAIPGAVLNIYSTRYADEMITDPTGRSAQQNGNVYSIATREFIESFSEQTRSQIIGVFEKAPSKVFLIGMDFLILAFLLSFWEREVKLRKVLETEFGLEERMEGKRDGK
ncbi:hypothetical protein BHYA_0230g00040 [Botrytis hyacinthi]|uniref:Major facilitator superfamily (MFS) profile domain-containing protein n=1 Tax=Botrytis hyacinthi TaxID=278943 RepID=A0A4Z1G9T7_9HELO|nr:hypothetical protein BHYA_0230g00040 [Botrytis hyacinthi]